MFGYLTADMGALPAEEQDRYKQVYCGLCHTMGQQLGQRTRLTLSHDLTFIALLLMSLYEPQETLSTSGCPVHPLERRTWTTNAYVEYAADMNVALMYHKCLDDWNDDHSHTKHTVAKLLEKAYLQAQTRWPRQCSALEQGLARISEIECTPQASPDEAGNVFGLIMGELVVVHEDQWAETLRAFGRHLGRFVYQMDAACDLEDDLKSGSYNPFAHRNLEPEDIHSLLLGYMGAAVNHFERLPLVQDIHLLRSVLYAGCWHRYNKLNETKSGEAA
ncbi:MAG: DUF5685 family protein [Coriobacteriia bacterium]|nr:DUF5685 family protein [Coriobacteriia bacterium]